MLTMEDYAAQQYELQQVFAMAAEDVQGADTDEARVWVVKKTLAWANAQRGDVPEVWALEPIDAQPGQFEFHLQVKNRGSYFQIAGGVPFLTTFHDQEAAELQALTLSLLPQEALLLHGWRGEFAPDDAQWSVVVVKTRGNYVAAEFRNGGWVK
jgi:hypothetical protein